MGISHWWPKKCRLLAKTMMKLINKLFIWTLFIWQKKRNKYLGSQTLAQIEWKQGYTHFWASLVKVKQVVFTARDFSQHVCCWDFERIFSWGKLGEWVVSTSIQHCEAKKYLHGPWWTQHPFFKLFITWLHGTTYLSS
jgi:hypothetical protein